MSMFDRLGIPEDLMHVNGQDILYFHDALAPLISYSHIGVAADGQVFDMHQLVQLSVRASLDEDQQLQYWQATLQIIMARIFPNGDYKNWAQC